MTERREDQAWFWEPEWLEGELEATEQAAGDQGTTYWSSAEFLESLRD